MTDPVTTVAADLSAILTLALDLEDQAEHKANDREHLPGGDATVALSPVASPEAWENIFEARERLGLDTSHVADEDDGWEPPLQTILFWSEQWRVEHNRESDHRPTMQSEVTFLRQILNWANEHEPHFEDFTRDIHGARVRLENLLLAGLRNQRGVQCFDCKVDLVRHVSDRRTHGSCCLAEASSCNHDRGGLRDWWECPNCERTYGVEDYHRAVQWAHFLHAEFLPLEQCAERTGVKAGTIKVWVNRGKVSTKRHTESGRVTYSVSDVESRLAGDAVA